MKMISGKCLDVNIKIVNKQAKIEYQINIMGSTDHSFFSLSLFDSIIGPFR